MFSGSMVALVTPFQQGKIDQPVLEKLVDIHVRSGTHAIVPCGTTGESATLSHDENERVVEMVIEKVGGRIPVIAGTGSNATSEAIRMTRSAQAAGADGSLQVAPYYNRPSQEGLYSHFMKIADAVSIPLVLYNIPSRTGVNIELNTFLRLAEHENIVAVKEASGKIDVAAQLVRETDLAVLAGDDSMILPILALGGKGVVSVAANVMPTSMANIVDAFFEGDLEKSRSLYYQLLPLFKALFVEVNPVPIKTIMSFTGIMSAELRSPLAPLKPENKAFLRTVAEGMALEVGE